MIDYIATSDGKKWIYNEDFHEWIDVTELPRLKNCDYLTIFHEKMLNDLCMKIYPDFMKNYRIVLKRNDE